MARNFQSNDATSCAYANNFSAVHRGAVRKITGIASALQFLSSLGGIQVTAGAPYYKAI